MDSTTPLAADLPDESNISDLLLSRHAVDPSRVLFVRKTADGYSDITAEDFLGRVTAAAKGLMALGVTPGQSVAVMSSTRIEWTVADFAIFFAGAVTVPIYETSSAHQTAWILSDSEIRVAFAENEQKAEVLRQAARVNSAEPPQIILLSDDGLADLARRGEGVTDAELEAARSSRTLDDVATVVYTSGTTGQPKGCEITHRSFAVVSVNAVEFLPEFLKAPDARTIMFLPLAHVLARCVQLVCIERGITLLHATGAAGLVDDMAAFRPTFLLAVPRVFEKIYAQARSQAQSGGKGRIFDAAAKTAIDYSRAERPGPLLRAKHAVFDRLVYRRIRDVFGGLVKYTVSGASPLAPSLSHFFDGAGIVILEGYGLTESTAPLTVNPVREPRIGTVGLPMPGTTLRIAEDGEVLARGVGIFSGYRNNEEATRQSFRDGWFATGDMGRLDEDGYLTITGRKKELIVTAGGKNVAPTPLEERIREHDLVDQAVLIGEGRPFVSAIIALDAEALPRWSKAELGRTISPEEAVTSEEVRAAVQTQVDYANELVSRAEGVRRFVLTTEPFDEGSGRLTPSLKLRRSVVLTDFADEIESLYRR
ncbi:AMP-dependent synthetase/ligase [Falsarthrobacter nasiphocae]|nr:AMP-dependent synthetase/ligase [Falsarthrobacter nasiphocae]